MIKCKKACIKQIISVCDGVHLECVYCECRNSFRAFFHLPNAGSSVGVCSGSLMIPSAKWTWELRNVLVVPPQESRTVCVSWPVADLTDMIPEEPVCDSAEENLQGALGPQQHKAAKQFEKTRGTSSHLTSLSISLPQLTMTHLFIIFFSLSQYLHLICFRPQLLLSCFHPSVLTIEPSVNIKTSWETRLSLIQTPFGVSRSRRSLQKTQSFRHAADLSFQWCSSGIFCWIVCF